MVSMFFLNVLICLMVASCNHTSRKTNKYNFEKDKIRFIVDKNILQIESTDIDCYRITVDEADSDKRNLLFTLNSNGSEKLKSFTTANLKRKVTVYLGNHECWTESIKAAIELHFLVPIDDRGQVDVIRRELDHWLD